LGIKTTKDGNLIVPIPIIVFVVKFLIFTRLVDYRSIQQIINEFKDSEEYIKDFKLERS